MRFAVAKHEGLTEDLVAQIDDGYEDSTLSPRHKAALRFSDAFLRDPHGLSESARAELLEHYSAEQIVELAAGLAMFMGTSKIAVALGNAPSDMPVMELPTPVRPST